MTPIEADIARYLQWMEVHNYAATTVCNRRRYLAYFAAFATGRGVDDATAVTLELLCGYQHQLFAHRKRDGAPLSFGTQAQRLVPVAQFFSWLRRLPEATLSAAEMSALLAVPDVGRPLGLRDRALLELFYSCGLRRAELIALAERDVDFARGTVFVRNGKGGKDRYVPVGERALFWLRLYIELARPVLVGDRPRRHLFVSSTGNPLCSDWLCRKVREYLAAAGIAKRGSCHLIRHSVATLMLEGGADVRYVAEMLGHARLETTQRYTHVSIERLRVVHAAAHPAAGLDVAMATELCAVLPSTTRLFGREDCGTRTREGGGRRAN